MGDPQPNSAVRSVDDPRDPIRCQTDDILRLQASAWDDKARVGYLVTSGRSVWISVWISGQYSAAEASTIARSSGANISAIIDAQRTASLADGLRGSAGCTPGISQGRTAEIATRRGARPNAVRSTLGPNRCPNCRWACRTAARACSPGWGSGLGGRSSRPAFWTPRTDAVLLSPSVA
jgi:hypothetical protein